LKMSEQRAKYNIETKAADQAQEKPQPVGITLNSEQVKGVLHCIGQKSSGLIIAEAAKILVRDPEQLSENDAEILLKASIQRYPEMSQKVIANMDNMQGS
jgi:hypothetical protein